LNVFRLDEHLDRLTYSQRMMRMEPLVPADVVRDGVRTNEHTLEMPRSACRLYWWTVRARFRTAPNACWFASEWSTGKSGVYSFDGCRVGTRYLYRKLRATEPGVAAGTRYDPLRHSVKMQTPCHASG
jgi:branched-subunit amino acid aminotransferase/4-amino-4-deoxychorismate lyase